MSSPTPDAATAVAPSISPSLASASTSLGALASTGATGVITAGGPYNLRTGPGTNYSLVGKIESGTLVTIVCTATGTAATGPSGTTTVWNKLSTGSWFTSAYVQLNAGAPTVPHCGSSLAPAANIPVGTRGDNYPYINDPDVFDSSECPNDPWGFCKRQCTSFVTWRIRDVNGVAFKQSYGNVRWGRASGWDDAARTLGYTVNRTPKVGAVAQWNSTSNMPVGHVAWVAAVSTDGSRVTIEEYNWGNRGTYGTRTISTSSVHNFVHLY